MIADVKTAFLWGDIERDFHWLSKGTSNGKTYGRVSTESKHLNNTTRKQYKFYARLASEVEMLTHVSTYPRVKKE